MLRVQRTLAGPVPEAVVSVVQFFFFEADQVALAAFDPLSDTTAESFGALEPALIAILR